MSTTQYFLRLKLYRSFVRARVLFVNFEAPLAFIIIISAANRRDEVRRFSLQRLWFRLHLFNLLLLIYSPLLRASLCWSTPRRKSFLT